jgi:hypothetical protein
MCSALFVIKRSRNRVSSSIPVFALSGPRIIREINGQDLSESCSSVVILPISIPHCSPRKSMLVALFGGVGGRGFCLMTSLALAFGLGMRRHIWQRKSISWKPQGSGRKPQGLGRKTKGSGRKTKGLGRKTKGSGRKTKGSGRKAKGSGRKAKGSTLDEPREGRKRLGTGQIRSGSGLERLYLAPTHHRRSAHFRSRRGKHPERGGRNTVTRSSWPSQIRMEVKSSPSLAGRGNSVALTIFKPGLLA